MLPAKNLSSSLGRIPSLNSRLKAELRVAEDESADYRVIYHIRRWFLIYAIRVTVMAEFTRTVSPISIRFSIHISVSLSFSPL